MLTELGPALAESKRLESLAAEGLRALDEAPRPARATRTDPFAAEHPLLASWLRWGEDRR